MITEKMTLRRIAGILLVISGITHFTQLFVYPLAGHVIGAALFGVIYFFLGIGILTKGNLVLYWTGIVVPSIGGLLGVYRFLHLQANPFSVFHVSIDSIVVPICIYSVYLFSGTNRCP